MPFKNSEKYLQPCLDSISNQIFKEFQLVAINDMSQDSSEKIIKKWAISKKQKIKIIPGDGLGIGHALQKGLAYCDTEFIARMDSDDISDSRRFIVQYETMLKNPKIKLLGSSCNLINSAGQFIGKVNCHLSDTKIRKILFFKNPFVHGSVMFSAEACRIVGGYSETQRLAEDYDLWFRMISRYQCGNIQEKLYSLRKHHASDTSLKRSEYLKKSLYTRKKAIRNHYVSPYYKLALPFLSLVTNLLIFKSKFN